MRKLEKRKYNLLLSLLVCGLLNSGSVDAQSPVSRVVDNKGTITTLKWNLVNGSTTDIYNTNSGKVGIGTSTPAATLDVKGTMNVTGTLQLTGATSGAITLTSPATITSYGLTLPDAQGSAGSVLTNDGTGTLSWGTSAASFWSLKGNSGTTAGTNFIGTTDDVDVIFKRNDVQAGWFNSTNTALGVGALPSSTTGYNNNAMGGNALSSNTTGSQNIALGNSSLQSNTTGIYNIALGHEALYSNTDGKDNTAIGVHALYQTTGDYNIALGYSAGAGITTGSRNIVIGNAADVPHPDVDYQMSIANVIYGVGLNSSTPYIGIGTNAPAATLDVTGTMNVTGTLQLTGATSGAVTLASPATVANNYGLILPDTQGSAGSVLTNDGSGTLSWGDPATVSWSLKGNSGTDATKNFIGTTDNVDVIFKRNNVQAGWLSNGSNTAFGVGALPVTTVTSYNAGFGYEALGSNTGAGRFNIAMGYQALKNNLSGQYNSALGYLAMLTNTVGSNNTALGSESMLNNIAGGDNVAIGSNALYNNVNGGGNTALGSSALKATKNTSNNTAVGNQALYFTTGENNTAIGGEALYNSTGSNNTALGYKAGFDLTGGSNNIALGNKAQVPVANADNQMSIGNVIYGLGLSTSTPYIGINNSAPTVALDVTGDGKFSGTLTVNGSVLLPSDVRLKTHIETLTGVLQKIDNLRGVRYEFIDQKKYAAGPQIGVIAQELQKQFPELVTKKTDGYLAVNYTQLTAVLIEAVKELRNEIELIKQQQVKQQQQITSILEMITRK